MELSVVLAAHNEAHVIAEQLTALVGQDVAGEWELIVVDNCSTDDTAAVAAAFADRHPHVRVVAAGERPSKTYAVAQGVEAAAADLLVFCDADDVVAPGWLAAMAAGLARHDVVTGPNELDRLNPPHLANSRGRSGDAPAGDFFGLFPFVRGNNWGIRRSTWETLGGLSEGAFPVEDLEFSARCWLAGITVVGLADAVVHYRYRTDTRSLWRQGFAYGAGRPRVARLLRDANRPGPPPFAGWRSWVRLVLLLPTLPTAHGRARWVWIAANRLGQVAGSIRHRVVML